jgi:hypothetical protein
LDSLRLYAAHRLIVVGKRGLAGVPQQLIDRVDGAADDPLYRPHAHAFAEEGENLGALGEGQLVHAAHYMNFHTYRQAENSIRGDK